MPINVRPFIRLIPLLLISQSVFPAATTGSLWRAQTAEEVSWYADRVAARPGELVTIIVRLNTTGSRQGKTKTERENTLAETLGTFVFGPRTGQTGDRGFNFYRSGGEAPSFNWNGTRSFEGGGSIDSRESLTTTLTARILEVSPAGVARIEARREYEGGKERSVLVLTGWARVSDIGLDNRIESTRLADLRIHQEGSGPLSRDQEKGWLTRVLESVNPF